MQRKARKIRIDLQYDGTRYVGWQRQTNGLSVQEVLEESLESLTGKRTRVEGSGRTDAGVHALGQVAAFVTDSSIPPERFHLALNTRLPEDIIVDRSREVPADWDPRRDAIERRYRYTIDRGETPLVTMRGYAWHFPRPLNEQAMTEAVGLFVGRHDFGGFRAADCDADHAVRTINESRLIWEERFLYFEIHGHAFLRNMVRIMMGTLVDIGMGRKGKEDLLACLETGDHEKAGPTAPAKGLCLTRVVYPEESC